MSPSYCHQFCGDGIRPDNPDWFNPRRNLFKLMEWQCDDGNRDPGDGCDDNCRVEEGFLCEYYELEDWPNRPIWQNT